LSTRAPRLPSGCSALHAPRSAARRGLRVPAVPHRRYRLGAVSTRSAEGYRRLTLWAGAAASFARRVVCRPKAAGSWASSSDPPATSASSARPSQTSRCARSADYPLEYPRTAAPVRLLRTARAAPCRTAWAASTRSTPPALPPRLRSTHSALGYRRVLKRTESREGGWFGRIEEQANHYVPVLRVRGGTKQGTAQAIQGALAYADGELQLRIADSFVSTAINASVRERVEPAVHRLDRRCGLWLVPSGIVCRMAACSERATVQPLSFAAAESWCTRIHKSHCQYAQRHQ
jgi:hypothetical protein